MSEVFSEATQFAQAGRQALTEALGFFDALNSGLMGWGTDQNTFWQPVQGGNGAYPPQANYLLTILQSPLYNRMQRWLARYLYKVNAYAISAVEGLSNLVIGPGYEIVADNDANQKRIDEWVEENNWAARTAEAYRRYLVDGEIFYRVFDGRKVRFVDPDFVYSSEPGAPSGIKTKPDDYETVEGYYVGNSTPWINGGGAETPKMVPAAEMQHRKLAFSYEPRGFSLLLAVWNPILKSTQLLDNLSITLDAQARIAAIRQHDATKDAVMDFRTGLVNQVPQAPGQQSQPPVDSIENYPAGSFIDTGKATEIKFPSEGLQADKYIDVLRAMLRMVACRVGIPEAMLSQDQDSLAAYVGSLVPNSYLVRSTQEKQQAWKSDDLKVLEMCGIPIKGVTIQFTSPIIVDKVMEHTVIESFLDRKIVSKATAAGVFNFNYEQEKELIKNEEPEETDPALQPAAEAAEVSAQPVPGDPADGDQETSLDHAA